VLPDANGLQLGLGDRSPEELPQPSAQALGQLDRPRLQVIEVGPELCVPGIGQQIGLPLPCELEADGRLLVHVIHKTGEAEAFFLVATLSPARWWRNW
jgi:hypothetical protein